MTKTKTERDSDFILERTKLWLTVERDKQSLNTPINNLCHLCKLNKEQQFLFIYNLIYQHETPIIYTCGHTHAIVKWEWLEFGILTALKGLITLGNVKILI